MCLAQGHNVVTPMRLKPGGPRSRVKHSTTEPLCSQEQVNGFLLNRMYMMLGHEEFIKFVTSFKFYLPFGGGGWVGGRHNSSFRKMVKYQDQV